MFDLEDASTDGTIDAQEFASVCASYGPDKTECELAFKKMSKVTKKNLFIFNKKKNLISLILFQGAVEVDREEFAKLWKEYFASEDPNAPGNFIFGKTSF